MKVVFVICCLLSLKNAQSDQTEKSTRFTKGLFLLRDESSGRRVLNGEDADHEEFPFAVVILTKKKNVHCGGTFIGPRVVLTAAHCVRDASEMDVVTQVTDLSQLKDSNVHAVLFTRVHPEYKSSKRGTVNDIALLYLSQYESPALVRLPEVDNSNTSITEFYDRGIAIGWGEMENKKKARRLKKVTLELMSEDECWARLGGKTDLTKQMNLCAYSPMKDACHGDSGGPLLVRKQDGLVQYGIVSWGVGCGIQDMPGVYTRVDHYLQWIQDNLMAYNSAVRSAGPDDLKFETEINSNSYSYMLTHNFFILLTHLFILFII